jgi:hypothetical protein
MGAITNAIDHKPHDRGEIVVLSWQLCEQQHEEQHPNYIHQQQQKFGVFRKSTGDFIER